jgi:hypothetical protein
MPKPSSLSATIVLLMGSWRGDETSLELSRDRRIARFVILWLVRMESCRIRSVGLVKIAFMEIVCLGGLKVATTLLVRFVGIRSIMVDELDGMEWVEKGKERGDWDCKGRKLDLAYC